MVEVASTPKAKAVKANTVGQAVGSMVNQAYVLKIKAFHKQGGNISTSDVSELRTEVNRLSSHINDGTSYVSAVAPVNPSENARWYDTESGRTYIWFNDGDSFQWVDDSPQAVARPVESINAAPVLAIGQSEPKQLNVHLGDLYDDDEEIKTRVNNLHTKRSAIKWMSRMKVTDSLQLYTKDGVEYLPNPRLVPFTTGATWAGDEGKFLEESLVTLHKMRSDSASQLGLKYLADWTTGLVIPNDAMTSKLAVWHDGQFYSAGTDTGFTSNDFDADLAAGRFIESLTLTSESLYYAKAEDVDFNQLTKTRNVYSSIHFPNDVIEIDNVLLSPHKTNYIGSGTTTRSIGTTRLFKSGLKKTTNNTVTLVDVESSESVTVDAIIALDSAWEDGKFFPSGLSISDLDITSDAVRPAQFGMYVQKGGGIRLRNTSISGASRAVYLGDCWLSSFDNCSFVGGFKQHNGTSTSLNGCSSTRDSTDSLSKGGYYVDGLIYSTWSNCATDHFIGSAYNLSGCKLHLDSCGGEGGTHTNPDDGLGINCRGLTQLTATNFCYVHKNDDVAPTFAFWSGDTVDINGGSSAWNSPSGADILVKGSDTNITFKNYTFKKGNKVPTVRMVNTIKNSKVTVHTTDGRIFEFVANPTATDWSAAANEVSTRSGSVSLLFNIDGHGTGGFTYEYNKLEWVKEGNIIHFNGRIKATTINKQYGVVTITGIPFGSFNGDCCLAVGYISKCSPSTQMRIPSGFKAISLTARGVDEKDPAPFQYTSMGDGVDIRFSGTMLYPDFIG